MAIRFDGEVALVTGAGRGIGLAHAECLAARGARVVVNSRDHGEADPADRSADRVVASILASGGEAIANHEDVALVGSGARMVEQALQTWGRLDIVICNASVAHFGKFHRVSLDDIRDMLTVNVMGTLELIHAALPVMHQARYGRILVTTSSSALGDVACAAYAASKTAMHGLVHSLALENRENGVLVNAVLPFAYTRLTEHHFELGVLPEEAAGYFKPERIAELAAFLVSRDCSVTGELLVAAGGTYRRLEMMQSRGLEIDPSSASAERALEGYAEIADMADPLSFACGGDMLLDLVESNRRAAGENRASRARVTRHGEEHEL